jgi:predicted HicB family RNase H-like nuclease
VSTRQAYRYVHKAQQARQPSPIPEAKAVFTVKLPARLIGQVRQQARAQDQSISDWVGQALQAFLERSRRHG